MMLLFQLKVVNRDRGSLVLQNPSTSTLNQGLVKTILSQAVEVMMQVTLRL